MRIVNPLLALVAAAALFTAGCTGPEQKLGRGFTNITEVTRMGEIQRSVEQTAVFNAPQYSYATGFIHGVGKTVGSTAMGAYEIVTFPLPPYHPILTKYVTPGTVYPDSFHPGLVNSSTFQTGTYFGFNSGSIAPFIPGNRFAVFPN